MKYSAGWCNTVQDVSVESTKNKHHQNFIYRTRINTALLKIALKGIFTYFSRNMEATQVIDHITLVISLLQSNVLTHIDIVSAQIPIAIIEMHMCLRLIFLLSPSIPDEGEEMLSIHPEMGLHIIFLGFFLHYFSVLLRIQIPKKTLFFCNK